jgi:hypothetical protein
MELQGISKRDISVLPLLASICEMREGEKNLQRLRKSINT